ncbi:hypothetical protein NDU88_009330 [Pleurodeles waltl]|uniref:Uncharacterized protein n=1 Tax=Pleurodeles waltl TaxID=8319 RepID=A0AAV7P218_PLEWA|nr:hypothetical protein NDU88_009330 [Pleurodeles waltl]
MCSPGPAVLVSTRDLRHPGSQRRSAPPQSGVGVFWGSVLLMLPFLVSYRLFHTPIPTPVTLPVTGRKPLFEYLQFPRWRPGTNGEAVFPGHFRDGRSRVSTSTIEVWVGLVRPITVP